MTPREKLRLLAALDALDALPADLDVKIEGSVWYAVGEEDAYGRAVDVLDSLALIESADSCSHGSESVWLADGGKYDLTLYSPYGCAPIVDRAKGHRTPIERLSEQALTDLAAQMKQAAERFQAVAGAVAERASQVEAEPVGATIVPLRPEPAA